MKKMAKRLKLHKETLRTLGEDLHGALGGKTALTALFTSCQTCPVTCTATEVGCGGGGA